MPERLTQAERSRVMAAVRSKDTTPEMIVRRMAHRLGYRFRLHRRDLPGTPDLAFPRLRKVIDVRGCFWHLHACRHGRRDPVRNAAYWLGKRQGNAARDARNLRQLRRLGWAVLTVWECQTRDADKLARRIARFLGGR
jgi:DNA mismatch endonuclease (patch repair protein)